MKKFGHVLLSLLLCIGLLTGCGTSFKADESTVFVLKNGRIVSTDVEDFDEKTYDKDGLTQYVKQEIRAYNDKNGKGSVALKKLEVGDKKATLTISYKTAEDYAKFNDIELYTGSIAEALAHGYTFEGDFASVSGGKITPCKSSDFTENSGYQVAIIRGNTNVKVKGKIQYVSTVNTRYVDEQTIAIREGTSLLLNQDADNTEKVTETQDTKNVMPEDSSQMTEESVSEEDLLNIPEESTEVEFNFDEADKENEDSASEFSQVYTYIIYQ